MSLVNYSFCIAGTPQIKFKKQVFGAGDSIGKSQLAKKDAIEQGAIQVTDSVRAKIYALQASMGDLPEVECPLSHVFAPGACARTIQIPAGTTVVGKIHKHRHLNILSQGIVSVITEGGGMEHLSGPIVIVSEPGTKRALYAHTDLVWTVVHVTDETDLEKLEKEVIAENYSDYEQFLLEHNKG
jgi:hypothetical protein